MLKKIFALITLIFCTLLLAHPGPAFGAITPPAVTSFKVPSNSAVTSNKVFYVTENNIKNNLIFVRAVKKDSLYGVAKIKAKIYKTKDMGGGTKLYSTWNGSNWSSWDVSASYSLVLFDANPTGGNYVVFGEVVKEVYYPTSSSKNINSFLSGFSKDEPVYIRVWAAAQTKTGSGSFFTFHDHSSESTYTAAVKLDKIKPTITISYPSETYLNAADFKSDFSGTFSDNESGIDTSYKVNCTLRDNTANKDLYLWPSTYIGSTWKSSISPSIATEGHSYTFRATTKDKVGNSSTASYNFTYDNTAPTNPQKIMSFTESYLTKTNPGSTQFADPKEITASSWRNTSIKPYIYFADGTDSTPGSGIKSYAFELAKYKNLVEYGLAFLGAPKNYVLKKTISKGKSDTSTPKTFTYNLSSKYFGPKVYEVIPSTSNLSDGLYEIRIKALDKAGNFAKTDKVFQFGIDTVAPPQPVMDSVGTESMMGGLPASGLTYTWKESIDATSGTIGYAIYIKSPGESYKLLDNKSFLSKAKGEYTSSGGKATYSSTSKLTVGTYYCYVLAKDAAGNWSTKPSSEFSYEIKEIPAPTLVSPTEGLKSSSLPTFTSKKSTLPTNAVNAIKAYNLYIYDSSNKLKFSKELTVGALAQMPSGSDISWEVSGAFDAGTHTWKVEVEDNLGNKKSSETRSFSLTQPVYPTISLLSPKDNELKTTSSVTFSWSTSKDFTTYDIYINGVKKSSTTSGTYTASLSDGKYTWYVKSTTTVGTVKKEISSSIFTVKVDTKEPAITAVKPAEGEKITSGTVNFTWSGSYKLSSYDLYVDGTKVKNTSDTKYSHSLADGSHTWYVASSYQGKTIKSSVRNFTINTEGPKIEAKAGNTALKDNITISPSANLSINMTDINVIDTSSIQVLVDGNKTEAKISSKDTAGKTVSLSSKLSLKEGTHTIKISAKDKLGKESSVSYTGLKTYSGDVQVLTTPMNYPNPFAPSSGQATTINYTLSDNANIKIMIFDIAGRMVWQNAYSSGSMGGQAGENEVTWNGKSFAGDILGNGAYLYVITSGGRLLKRGEMAIYD